MRWRVGAEFWLLRGLVGFLGFADFVVAFVGFVIWCGLGSGSVL